MTLETLRRLLAERVADKLIERAIGLVEQYREEKLLTEPEVKALLRFKKWLEEQRAG